MKKKLAVIGAGFSGLSAAAYLAKAGHEVHVFEKNATAGGRARQFTTDDGFVFDMGPSWYWMPGVFERFFNDFGHSSSDFYELALLDPSFEMVFREAETLKIPASFNELCELFDSIEVGSAVKLKRFMNEAELKYRIGMEQLAYKPSISIREYFASEVIRNTFRLDMFLSLSSHIRKYFADPRLISLLEFPALFLGARPIETPALYSLMNYAGLKLGTWYPKGGFGKVIEAMKKICEESGVSFHFSCEVKGIQSHKHKVTSIMVNNLTVGVDGIIASADYQHVEDTLLDQESKNYSRKYWDRRVMSPSSLIYYLGVNIKIERLIHHTLFFDESLDQHAHDIYAEPKWPDKPLFYVCCPSKSDPSVSKTGHENLFLLMPIASGLADEPPIREKYFNIMMNRLEDFTGEKISEHIIFKKSYCLNDFETEYHSFKGNAYGLANTLSQTAILRPKIKNYKIKNLFYAGQLTVPGPGVPPSIISGAIAAGLLNKFLAKQKDEIPVR